MNDLFCATDILLPKLGTDLRAWATLACDQHSSEPEYWCQVRSATEGRPSMLNLTLPEVYLDCADVDRRINQIHADMRIALDEVLTRSVRGYIYVERDTASGTRQGLVGAVDLEAYSYDRQDRPLIRPTEETVVERIPPRLAVREGAVIEAPHIMMLVDDADKTLIEPFAQKKNELDILYDTELMLGGGHIRGYAITGKADIERIASGVNTFGTQKYFDKKYPKYAGTPPMAIAVGDGNHSLATAKAYWEKIKQELMAANKHEQIPKHPARYCLVELVNIHSPAIVIEPIHRVLFGADEGSLLLEGVDYITAQGAHLCPPCAQAQCFTVINDTTVRHLGITDSAYNIPAGTLDATLTHYISQHKGIRLDYVHDEVSVRELAAKGNIGFILPPFAKEDIFKGVLNGGVLPRKTFSMGSACEKRYYLEARRISL